MKMVKNIAIILIIFIGCVQVVSAQETEAETEKRFKVGATFSLNSIKSDNFKEIYGSSVPSFGLDFGYMLTDRIDAWATVALASKSAKLTYHSGAGSNKINTKFNFQPMLSLNLRYHFLKKGAISLFGGGGLTGYQIKDKVDSADIKEVKAFMLGFNVHGGCRYNVAGSFYLQGLFRYNFVSKTKQEWVNKLELNGGEFLLGVGYGF